MKNKNKKKIEKAIVKKMDELESIITDYDIKSIKLVVCFNDGEVFSNVRFDRSSTYFDGV